jgi:ribonuclease P protein component
VIGRVHDRATFEALRRQGRRVRRGPVTVVYLPAAAPPPRAAFAISRKVGNAVARNKVRRRLRSILRELESPVAGEQLPNGTYLLTTRPGVAELPYSELSGLVSSACRAVTGADRSAR